MCFINFCLETKNLTKFLKFLNCQLFIADCFRSAYAFSEKWILMKKEYGSFVHSWIGPIEIHICQNITAANRPWPFLHFGQILMFGRLLRNQIMVGLLTVVCIVNSLFHNFWKPNVILEAGKVAKAAGKGVSLLMPRKGRSVFFRKFIQEFFADNEGGDFLPDVVCLDPSVWNRIWRFPEFYFLKILCRRLVLGLVIEHKQCSIFWNFYHW